MAIALVQQRATSSATTLAYSSANTAGSLLIACLFSFSSNALSCSDSQGNVYTAITTTNTGWGTINIFYAPNCNGGSNTVTGGGLTGGGELHITEWSGAATSSPLDVPKTAKGTVGGGTVSVGAFTPAANNELIFAFGVGSGPMTVGSGFTTCTDAGGGNISEYVIQTTAASVNPSYSAAGSTWAIMAAAFGTATPSVRRLMMLGVG